MTGVKEEVGSRGHRATNQHMMEINTSKHRPSPAFHELLHFKSSFFFEHHTFFFCPSDSFGLQNNLFTAQLCS